jgi:hypothetical protein
MEEETEGLPPFAKSWGRLYAIVIGELALLIALFYWFSKYYQ